MWTQISTVGFYGIVVEMTVRASGMSSIPHGIRPVGSRYIDQKNITLANDTFRPYQFCKDISTFTECPDALLFEEMLMIMYTTDYDPPYENGIPIFQEEAYPAHKRGITKWTAAKMIPRSVLMEDYSGSGKTLRIDFSSWSETDNNERFGLWIRSQLDSADNQVSIDDIKVYGRRIHQ